MSRMTKKYVLTFFLLFILIFLISNTSSISRFTTYEKVSKNFNKINTFFTQNHKLKSNLISQRIPYGSLWYVEKWKFDHYEQVPGKTLGVWPSDYSISYLTMLRSKLGYSGILIAPNQTQYNNAVSAGFKKIMISLTSALVDKRYKEIKNFGNVYAYYVDEPADQNHSIEGIKNAINNLGLNSLFIISGYKRTGTLNEDVNRADKVMFSSYKHWYVVFPGIWVSWPVDNDQTPDWSDMQRRYGNKFSMTWINTIETTEFDTLFAHAQNLGLTGMWVYSLDGHKKDQFGNISNTAFHYSFLKIFLRKWYDVYKCNCTIGCFNTPPDSGKCWKYLSSDSTGVVVGNK